MVQEEGFSFSDFAFAIWRRKLVFIFVALATLTAGLVIISKIPLTYRSTGVILVEQQEIPTQWVNSTVASFADERIRAITQRVLSTDNLASIINKFNLFPKLKGTHTPDEIVEQARNNFSIENVEAQVRDRISGGRNSGTVAIQISYEYFDPEIARDVASELVSLYLAANLEARTNAATGTRVFLQSEADRLETELANIETTISEFKEQNIGTLPEHQDINIQTYERVEQQIADIERTLGSLDERRVILETSIDSARRLLRADRSSSSSGEDTAQQHLQDLREQYVSLQTRYSAYHPDLIRLRREIGLLESQILLGTGLGTVREQLQQLNSQLQELKRKYTDEHPEVVALKKEITLLRESETGSPEGIPGLGNTLASETGMNTSRSNAGQNNGLPEDTALIGLQTDLKSAVSEQRSLYARRADLVKKLEELELRINKSPEVEREYRSLIRDHENLQDKYNDIRAKQNTARVAESLETEQKGERFTLIEAPRVADFPYRPDYRKLFLLAIGIAFVSSLGSIFGLEMLDARVRNVKVLESLSGVPVLATIGVIKNRNDRLQQTRKIVLLVILITLLLVVFLYLKYSDQASPEIMRPHEIWNSMQNLLIDSAARESLMESVRSFFTNLKLPNQ